MRQTKQFSAPGPFVGKSGSGMLNGSMICGVIDRIPSNVANIYRHVQKPRSDWLGACVTHHAVFNVAGDPLLTGVVSFSFGLIASDYIGYFGLGKTSSSVGTFSITHTLNVGLDNVGTISVVVQDPTLGISQDILPLNPNALPNTISDWILYSIFGCDNNRSIIVATETVTIGAATTVPVIWNP